MEEENKEMGAEPQDDQSDIEKNKGMAALSYLWILVLVPLLTAKDSKFAKHHAKQGLVLLIAEVIFGFVGWILAMIPVLGWLIFAAIQIYFLVMVIMGLVNALNGKYWKMPLLGQFADKFNF